MEVDLVKAVFALYIVTVSLLRLMADKEFFSFDRDEKDLGA